MTRTYPFTEADMQRANAEWGANCGPAALAFALHCPIDDVRPAIPDFDRKRYTSPSMMREAIRTLGQRIEEVFRDTTFDADGSTRVSEISQVTRRPGNYVLRIQWEGPWTAPGANPRWAYRQTHWIAAKKDEISTFVFDCNGGIRTSESWECEIAPVLAAQIKRATGAWFVTHCWRLV